MDAELRLLLPLLVAPAVLICHAAAEASPAEDRQGSQPSPRWSAEQAWQWYRQQPWLVGFNYVPSTACNTTEWWQAETFDPKTVDREMGWAADIGYNSARCFIQYLVWKHDPDGFRRRLAAFLQIAERHGISILPVLFDDCAFGQPVQFDPYLGKQREPTPGMILPSWTPSPGRRLARDPNERPMLRRYVVDVIGSFRLDRRVVMWDLYNEPMNVAAVGTAELLEDIFAWARQARPTQPVTVSVWNGNPTVSAVMVRQSDVVSYHLYGDREAMKRRIDELKALGRPVVCTEWMARARGSRFETDLPLLKAEGVGCYQWELVNGRTQAHFPWWNKPGGKVDPKSGWFHDILHADGRPYRQEEVDAIRRIIGREKR